MFCPFLKGGIFSCLKSDTEQEQRTNISQSSKNQAKLTFVIYIMYLLFLQSLNFNTWYFNIQIKRLENEKQRKVRLADNKEGKTRFI